MNQRVENELRSILNDLEKLGLLENELISDCLQRDGIQISRLNLSYVLALVGFIFIGLGYFGFFHVGARTIQVGKILIKRDVPAFVGRDNTLCFPAQVQIEKDGRYIERWHWDYGEYGDLNGFIHRFNSDLSVQPLRVTCYRQAERFKRYDPDIKPLPRSLAFIWSADQIIHYGVLDDESRNHGLWVKFSEDQAIEAELWNHGHQVGLSTLNNLGEWEVQAKVKGFDMPEDPINAWSLINKDYFDLNYARTLTKLEHETMIHSSTLGKLIDANVQYNVFKVNSSVKRSSLDKFDEALITKASGSANPWVDWEKKYLNEKKKVRMFQAWYHDDPTYIDGSVPRRGAVIDLSSLSNSWVDVFLENCYRDGRTQMLNYLKLNGYEPIAAKGKEL